MIMQTKFIIFAIAYMAFSLVSADSTELEQRYTCYCHQPDLARAIQDFCHTVDIGFMVPSAYADAGVRFGKMWVGVREYTSPPS